MPAGAQLWRHAASHHAASTTTHAPSSPLWSVGGTGVAVEQSQLEFMQKDECIVVDDRDTITGTANKYDTHTFGHETPRGVCHRAFSVFLFDEQVRALTAVQPLQYNFALLLPPPASYSPHVPGTAAPPAARVLQDHLPERVDQHVLLAPADRVRAD